MTLLILVLRAYGSRLSVIVFFNSIHVYYNYYLIAVRQYFAIAIILADQNHAIRLLLQCNNIANLQCMRYIELLPNPNYKYIF